MLTGWEGSLLIGLFVSISGCSQKMRQEGRAGEKAKGERMKGRRIKRTLQLLQGLHKRNLVAFCDLTRMQAHNDQVFCLSDKLAGKE